MAEFGQPQRTATSDANAGFVNPPAAREADRGAQSQSVAAVSDLDSATKNFGASMGKAFEEVLHKKANNINEKRALHAAMRQGEGKAINAIDAEKKRSGWSEALFGQSIDYREAQKRAVGNNIQQSYLEQANKISEFAAETGEQYKARLDKQLDAQLENFPNDPETRQVITDNWAKASEKLVQSQTKEHFGYAAQQQRQTTQDQVRSTFDTFTTESQKVTTPEEAQEFTEAGKRFLAGAAKPKGASRQAYTAIVREEIEYSLMQGNIGAYNMAKEYGYFDNYTKEQRGKLDVAIGKYDTKARQRIGLTVSEAKLGISGLTGKDAGEQLGIIMSDARAAITEHEGRSSGSEASALALSQGKLSLSTMLKPSIDAAAKAQEESLRAEEVVNALDIANTGDGTSLAALEGVTPKELKVASAKRIHNLVTSITGKEGLSTKEMLQEVIGDPIGVGSQVVAQWGQDEFDSGIPTSIAQSYINGFMSSAMVDENNMPTQIAQNTMQILSQFEATDVDKLRAEIGTKAFDEYLTIKQGQAAGKPSTQIESDIKILADAKLNAEYYGGDWASEGVGGASGVSKREYIKNLVTGYAQQVPEGVDIGNYVRVYGEGLLTGKGDHNFAKDALRSHVANKKGMFRGQVINNVDKVNASLSEYTLPLLLEDLQKPHINIMGALLRPALGKTEGADGVPIRSLDNPALFRSVKFKVSPDGGVWMTSPKFQESVYMSTQLLQSLERVVIQARGEKQMERTMVEATSIINHLKAQEQGGPTTRL